jgi:RNA polymerase sigma-70 factor (ECF subfamily)
VARLEHGSRAGHEVAAGDASPSQHAAGRELLVEFRKRLSSEEAELVDLRVQGREWADIAAERKESAEALRKRLTRALDRVAQQLGLDEAVDE